MLIRFLNIAQGTGHIGGTSLVFPLHMAFGDVAATTRTDGQRGSLGTTNGVNQAMSKNGRGNALAPHSIDGPEQLTGFRIEAINLEGTAKD